MGFLKGFQLFDDTVGIFFKERTKGGLNKRATIGAPLFSTLLVFPN